MNQRERTIVVQYYALLREERGLGQETLKTSAATAVKLYNELKAQHGFRLSVDRLRLAINNQFVPWTTPLNNGDTVVFIPPVAGG